jgi:hypothetical protein
MARAIPRWERLKPSVGESGAPGWRLVSADDAQQVAVYRKNEGPWKDATIFCEFRTRDWQWRFVMFDGQDRFVTQQYGEHYNEALDRLQQTLTDRNLPPLS